MTMLVVLIVVLVAAQAATGFLLWRGRRPTTILSRARRRVIVTLKSGESFAGVLFEADGAALVLREAMALEMADGQNVLVDGEALLLLADVAYVQFP